MKSTKLLQRRKTTLYPCCLPEFLLKKWSLFTGDHSMMRTSQIEPSGRPRFTKNVKKLMRSMMRLKHQLTVLWYLFRRLVATCLEASRVFDGWCTMMRWTQREATVKKMKGTTCRQMRTICLILLPKINHLCLRWSRKTAESFQCTPRPTSCQIRVTSKASTGRFSRTPTSWAPSSGPSWLQTSAILRESATSRSFTKTAAFTRIPRIPIDRFQLLTAWSWCSTLQVRGGSRSKSLKYLL